MSLAWRAPVGVVVSACITAGDVGLDEYSCGMPEAAAAGEWNGCSMYCDPEPGGA